VLLVEVSADWCMPCNQLAAEVLDTPTGLEVVGGDLAIRVDFESEEGQAIKRRFGVLGLPTLLVVHRDGYELGRVEGYPGRAEWVEAVRDARAGRAGIDALAKAARRAPRDKGVALELAQARLVRGDTGAALKVLDKLIAAVPLPAKRKPPKTDAQKQELELTTTAAAHAARIKGRWLLRVREEGAQALVHFAAMVERFAGTPHRASFIYWQANALEHLKRRDEAVALFVRWRQEPGESDKALAYQAEFMTHHGYPGAIEVARELLAKTPDASSHYLVSRSLQKAGDVAAAREHAATAVQLEPGTALYRNHHRQLVAP
jgi:Flp pilus assembly protein TadD